MHTTEHHDRALNHSSSEVEHVTEGIWFLVVVLISLNYLFQTRILVHVARRKLFARFTSGTVRGITISPELGSVPGGKPGLIIISPSGEAITSCTNLLKRSRINDPPFIARYVLVDLRSIVFPPRSNPRTLEGLPRLPRCLCGEQLIRRLQPAGFSP